MIFVYFDCCESFGKVILKTPLKHLNNSSQGNMDQDSRIEICSTGHECLRINQICADFLFAIFVQMFPDICCGQITFSSVTDMISIVPSGKMFPPPCFKLINRFEKRSKVS